MGTEVRMGSRIIGTVKREDSGIWSYEGACVASVKATNQSLIENCKSKDDAVRALRACYVVYALNAVSVPTDLGWNSIPGIPGREFLTRPSYTEDPMIYGQRRSK